jgi:hypothetical protein
MKIFQKINKNNFSCLILLIFIAHFIDSIFYRKFSADYEENNFLANGISSSSSHRRFRTLKKVYLVSIFISGQDRGNFYAPFFISPRK